MANGTLTALLPLVALGINKVDHALVFGIEVISVDNGHSNEWLFVLPKAIARQKYLAKGGGRGMISAKLVDGISLKSCKVCDTYATTSVDEMLSHLEIHNQEEITALKDRPMVYRRVLKE